MNGLACASNILARRDWRLRSSRTRCCATSICRDWTDSAWLSDRTSLLEKPVLVAVTARGRRSNRPAGGPADYYFVKPAISRDLWFLVRQHRDQGTCGRIVERPSLGNDCFLTTRLTAPLFSANAPSEHPGYRSGWTDLSASGCRSKPSCCDRSVVSE